MSQKKILIILKVVHTISWLFLIYLIGYVWYCVFLNKTTKFLWVSIIFIIGEGIILLTNKRKCPITNLALKYSDNHEPGFDIYLPKWLAKYNVLIFTFIATVGIFIIIFRYYLNIIS